MQPTYTPPKHGPQNPPASDTVFRVEYGTSWPDTLFLFGNGHCHQLSSLKALIKLTYFRDANPQFIPVFQKAIQMMEAGQTGEVVLDAPALENAFPFWYESQDTWGEINSLEDLRMRCDYRIAATGNGINNVGDFLSKSRHSKDWSRNFGTRREHTGDLTLREHLRQHGLYEQFVAMFQ